MITLEWRLRELEASLTDDCGQALRSPQWRVHWTRELETVLRGIERLAS
jgi:hypothetical protein